MFLGCSPFNLCRKYRDQNKVLLKVEEKFVDELEVSKMLGKIRDSHDVIKNLVSKEYRGLLLYNKNRVVDIDHDTSSDSCDDVSSSDDENKFN